MTQKLLKWAIFTLESEAPEANHQFNGNLAEMKKYVLTTANGLLYRDGKELSCPAADTAARENGFHCAEQLVRHLEANP